jgi:hypothetical protein
MSVILRDTCQSVHLVRQSGSSYVTWRVTWISESDFDRSSLLRGTRWSNDLSSDLNDISSRGNSSRFVIILIGLDDELTVIALAIVVAIEGNVIASDIARCSIKPCDLWAIVHDLASCRFNLELPHLDNDVVTREVIWSRVRRLSLHQACRISAWINERNQIASLSLWNVSIKLRWIIHKGCNDRVRLLLSNKCTIGRVDRELTA